MTDTELERQTMKDSAMTPENTDKTLPVEQVELEPCPFCGSGDVELYRPALTKLWRVCCNACEISGQIMPDKTQAIASWNQRAPATPPAEDEVGSDIRIAIWKAGMKGGMGQDLTQAFIRRAMKEPTMQRALSSMNRPEASEGEVERVARAIYEAEPCPPGLEVLFGYEVQRQMNGPSWIIYDRARAAIAAMPGRGERAGIVALLAALSKVMPARVQDGPDYAEVYFADGSTHSTQAMTMNPQDWRDLQSAFDAIERGDHLAEGG